MEEKCAAQEGEAHEVPEKLSLEMRLKKLKITKVEAAKQLGISRESLHWKVKGIKPFLLREALKLHSLYFAKENFEDVFAEYEMNRVR